MNMTFEEKILNAYIDGFPLEVIAEGYMVTTEQVTEVLHTYRDSNRMKRAFSKEFKILIAERDMNGAARSDIAKELGININTVKKSCEEFGQSFKERAVSDRMFTRIEGVFSREECVNCKSTRYNKVDDNAYYCMSCDKEFVYEEDAVLHVNWEYFD